MESKWRTGAGRHGLRRAINLRAAPQNGATATWCGLSRITDRHVHGKLLKDAGAARRSTLPYRSTPRSSSSVRRIFARPQQHDRMDAGAEACSAEHHPRPRHHHRRRSSSTDPEQQRGIIADTAVRWHRRYRCRDQVAMNRREVPRTSIDMSLGTDTVRSMIEGHALDKAVRPDGSARQPQRHPPRLACSTRPRSAARAPFGWTTSATSRRARGSSCCGRAASRIAPLPSR